MLEVNQYPGQLVFGLDIGTRSIVGTVGYKTDNKFYVVSQVTREHETRAMLDGQIHDIHKVGNTIREVKEYLEKKTGRKLSEVCIAAAGRVLRTVTTTVEVELGEDKVIGQEDIYALDSAGMEKAYEEFQNTNTLEEKFYCVGYSIVHYYMNGHLMSNLEGHKAHKIGEELIATFLPDEVVDGLYRAVELAGLEVANLTLEPIAAIQVAIPENFRMLNIALVDVGAGTSDISITKDGSIVAYGMLPCAGDGLTEVIAQHCLVDFAMAEHIKRGIMDQDVVEYQDIMMLPQTITREEVLDTVTPIIDSMTQQVADKIQELNGGKPVSAVFVVGGGGKIATYTEKIAMELGIQKERVALRGKEVMQSIEFLEEGIEKDSLLVTPIGICLNFYEQSNNFIYVTFNGERIKLYDNSKLAIVDAAMQADFPKEALFPRRGKELNILVNGKNRIIRGELGEPAEINLNGEKTDISTKIHGNDVIQVTESTYGEPARMEIQRLPEFHSTLEVWVNERKIMLPKFASVNGTLKSGYYEIQDQDQIEMLNYYTVAQVAEFMDIVIDMKYYIYVNNKRADKDTKVFENFSVVWTLEEQQFHGETDWKIESGEQFLEEDTDSTDQEKDVEEYMEHADIENADTEHADIEELDLSVVVNGKSITMHGKSSYVFVDIFEYIDFDLSSVKGKGIVTRKNGVPTQYMEELSQGDVIEIYWS
ncbi:MAG: cell division FtsA domain-containing protein [Lachnospiraceae bacterium]|nr:cell division FtsA domain-containing protein [Lachnospiraceae bacterium]